MGSTNKCERELERCIDAMIEEMNGHYCGELEDEAEIDARLADINLRDRIIGQIREVLRCKKLSERISRDQQKEVAYVMETRIGSNGLAFGISHSSSSMPSLE